MMVPSSQYQYYQMKLHLNLSNNNFNRNINCFTLPAARRIYGSLISVFNEAPSIGSLDTPGFNTVNCNTID